MIIYLNLCTRVQFWSTEPLAPRRSFPRLVSSNYIQLYLYQLDDGLSAANTKLATLYYHVYFFPLGFNSSMQLRNRIIGFRDGLKYSWPYEEDWQIFTRRAPQQSWCDHHNWHGVIKTKDFYINVRSHLQHLRLCCIWDIHEPKASVCISQYSTDANVVNDFHMKNPLFGSHDESVSMIQNINRTISILYQ